MALLLAGGAAHAEDAGGKPVVVREIARTKVTAAGQPIVLPSGPVTATASSYVIAPGSALPVHKHPYPRYAYVLSGELTVTEAESGKTYAYKAGDFIVEVVDLWHSGRNSGSVPVELLVVDQTPEGAASTVLRPAAPPKE